MKKTLSRFLRQPIIKWGLITLVVLAVLIWSDYRFGWSGWGLYRHPQSGDPLWGKSLWDWLDLLIVPLVLAGGALLFNRSERRAEREIADARRKQEQELALQRSQEATLQNYLDKMTELLLEKGLRKAERDSEVRDIARARTLTALRVLDGTRKGLLLRFLCEAGLIRGRESRIDLRQADLSEAFLVGADLSRANLSEAILSEAILSEANLSEATLILADLSEADLSAASLSGADLMGANLRRADLSRTSLKGAQVDDAQLNAAKSLEGAIMPDGTKND